MARTKLHTIRSGPTTITGVGIETMASWSLSEITSGMANNDFVYVDVVAMLLSGPGYSCLFSVTMLIQLTAGPTYTFGAQSVSQINRASGGSSDFDAMIDSATLDQSSGTLRLRSNSTVHAQGGTCYAVLNSFGT